MPKLGEPNFDWTAPCHEAEYRRWTRQASFNFSVNIKTRTKKVKHLAMDMVR